MSEVWMPPRFGPWQEPSHAWPNTGELVLGFYGANDCVKTRVVYCGDSFQCTWFDDDDNEVDQPDCWAQIIYPTEDQ